MLEYQKDLDEVSSLKKGLKSLRDAMNIFEEVLGKAEEALEQLKSLPPFKADYKKFHWITKYDEVDYVIEKLGAPEAKDDLIDVSSLFEENCLERRDSSYERACSILKQYRSREEYSEDSLELSFNSSRGDVGIQNSTMLKKDQESEKWKEDLFGVSFIVNERFALKHRRSRSIEPSKVTTQEGFVDLAFNFEHNQDFVYTCDELGSSTDDDLVSIAQLFDLQKSPEEDMLFEDIDNAFVLLPEIPGELEEKLELPANISEFPFNFGEDDVEVSKSKNFCVNIAKSKRSPLTFR